LAKKKKKKLNSETLNPEAHDKLLNTMLHRENRRAPAPSVAGAKPA
jgi:hypothetical protein